jgi:Dolichyl-phosphate-mannose-protein mannosyltransferase
LIPILPDVIFECMSNHVSRQNNSSIRTWHVIATFLGIALLRFWRLAHWDIWYDEAFSVYMANHLKPLWTGEYSFHPPGFYLLIVPYLKLFNTPFCLRFLPYVFGLATILTAYFFMQRLFDRRTALISMILAGCAPMHVYYSREFRMYAIVGFLYILTWYLLLKMIEKPSFKQTCFYVLSWAAFCYLHYYAVFALAAQALAILFLDVSWKKRWTLWGSMGLSGVLYLPWIGNMLVMTNRLMVKADYWAPEIGIRLPIRIMRVLVTGYEPSRTLANPMVLIVFLAILLSMKVGRYRQNVFLFSAAFLPFILSVVIGSALKFDFLIARYVVFTVVPIYLFVAPGISRQRWFLGISIFLVIFSMESMSLSYQYRNIFHDIHWDNGVRPRKAFKAASDYVMDRVQPGDIIGHACNSSYGPFYYYMYYLNGVYAGRPLDLDGIIIDSYNKGYGMEGMYDNFGDIVPVDVDEFIVGANRLWFIASEWDSNAFGTFSTNYRWDLQYYIESRYPVISKKIFYGVPVLLVDLKHPYLVE